MKTEARSFRISTLAIVLLMLATLFCGFTVMSSAEGAQITVDIADLDLSALQENKDDTTYSKEYDGTTAAQITVKADADITLPDGVTAVKVKSAVFNDANVANASYITVTFELEGEKASQYSVRSITVPATVTPAPLDWDGKGTATGTVQIGVTSYELPVTLPKLTGIKKVNGTDDTVNAKATVVAVNDVKLGSDGYKKAVTVNVALDNGNYVAKPLTVDVEIKKIVIQEIQWPDNLEFAWGDDGIYSIKVYGYDYDKDNKPLNSYELVLTYPTGYGDVKADGHVVTATLPNANYMEFAQNATTSAQAKVVIKQAEYVVDMNDVSFIGDAGIQTEPSKFSIAVLGDKIPADIRALIEYKLADGTAFEPKSAYGAYEVTATLPQSDNYKFVDADGNDVTTLTATMYINQQYIHSGPDGDEDYQIILLGQNGFAGDVDMTVSIPEKIARKAIRGFHVYKGYTLSVENAGDATFTVLLTISDSLYHKRCEDLTVNDLYIYEEATGTMIKATEKTGYKVTLEEGHYRIEGVSGGAAVTFVIAPVYNVPFLLSAPGIALLIFLVLALIVLMGLIGLYLYRIRKDQDQAVLVIDEGEVAEVEPVELEDNVDADAFLEETAEEVAEGIDTEAAAEETEAEGVEEAVAESMQELVDEASAIELAEVVEEDETDAAAEMVEEKAEELEETVEAEQTEVEADEDAVADAVADAMAENFNESADATDAVVIVAEEEEESDELTFEDFKAVVDAIVGDAMARTMDLPEATEEEATEEATEEAAEEAVTEEAPAENADATVDAAEEVTEETTEEVTEETAEETTEEVTEEATEEATEEIVVEEMSGEDVCAVVADSVAEAFELITVDGVTPKAVEGTTLETITDAVKDSADERIPETWTEAMAEAVTAAVIDELAARLLVEEEPAEEEAVEAFAEVEVPEEKPESDEDDDNDDDDDDDDETGNYGGFGSMPLTFIDAVAEAEKYAEMLEQERNGEIIIVTRYRRSFQSRLTQSQGNVQDYYTILKNALLSYKGVKNRISWNYEAFNRGRTHVAKLNAKTKTLYLYLALDPEELKDTKYGIVDVSSKKKYASVPVLMKIKGDRKFKYALELIEKLCGEKLELPKMEIEEVDYHVPYQTTEELVEAGIIKKMVASVPVSAYGAASTEDAPVEATPSAATEAQDVTFIEPTTAPAVEAAAEEVAAEEAAQAEVPADAPASEDNTTEV